MIESDHLSRTTELNDSQRLIFLSEFNAQRKNATTAALLALFLGGLGAHRFYMGQIGMGMLYLVFSVTLIPLVVSLVEIFLMSGRVARFNAKLADELVEKIKA